MFQFSWIALVILVGTVSCSRNQEKIVLPKIARAIPNFFIEATNHKLSKNQDTVFYQKKYFSGHIFQLYPATADTAFVISYLNGLEEGFTKKWYSNKQLAEERLYVHGKKEGVHKAWWPDGKPKFIFEVTNDAYSGELKEWYSSGRLFKDFNYTNGQEEGSQHMWWADGRVRANYVVRNGRKYGSIGIKLCLNPNDSIYKK